MDSELLIKCQLPACQKEFMFDDIKNKHDLFCSDECRSVFADMEKTVRINHRLKKEKEHKQQIIYKKRRLQKSIPRSFTKIKDKNSRNKYIKYLTYDKSKKYSTLSINEFIKIMHGAICIYCGYNKDIGLDRLNNNMGHIIENVVPCCALCNMTRNNYYTHEEFKLIGSAIKQIRDARQNTY